VTAFLRTQQQQQQQVLNITCVNACTISLNYTHNYRQSILASEPVTTILVFVIFRSLKTITTNSSIAVQAGISIKCIRMKPTTFKFQVEYLLINIIRLFLAHVYNQQKLVLWHTFLPP